MEETPSKQENFMARLFLKGGEIPTFTLAMLYLAAMTVAELIITFVEPLSGLLLHTLLLFILFLHAASHWERPTHRLLLALALAPLIRIVSLSLPLPAFPFMYWFLITSLPLFAAAYVVMRILDISWRDPGLARSQLPMQLLIGASGLLLGFTEYLILRPEPFIEELTWQALWMPALILFVSTGYMEELVFRRIMQEPAMQILGRWTGLIYVAAIFAVLHIGYKSLIDVVFVFAAGLFFGWAVWRTDSLVGVTISHGLTNSMLFLVMPFLWTPAETPLPTPDPINIVTAPVSTPTIASTATAEIFAPTSTPLTVPTATVTLTSTPILTATATATSIPATSTPTPTPPSEPTATVPPTASATATVSASITPSPTAEATDLPPTTATPSSATPTPTPTIEPTATILPTPSATATVSGPVKVDAQSLFDNGLVRRGPHDSYPILTILSPGQTYELSARSTDGNWVRLCCVETSNEEEGWVAAELLAIEGNVERLPVSEPPPQAAVQVGRLNIRSGPGTEYEVIAIADEGQTFAIQAHDPARVWWQICCINEQSGWLFGESIAIWGDADEINIERP